MMDSSSQDEVDLLPGERIVESYVSSPRFRFLSAFYSTVAFYATDQRLLRQYRAARRGGSEMYMFHGWTLSIDYDKIASVELSQERWALRSGVVLAVLLFGSGILTLLWNEPSGAILFTLLGILSIAVAFPWRRAVWIVKGPSIPKVQRVYWKFPAKPESEKLVEVVKVRLGPRDQDVSSPGKRKI